MKNRVQKNKPSRNINRVTKPYSFFKSWYWSGSVLLIGFFTLFTWPSNAATIYSASHIINPFGQGFSLIPESRLRNAVGLQGDFPFSERLNRPNQKSLLCQVSQSLEKQLIASEPVSLKQDGNENHLLLTLTCWKIGFFFLLLLLLGLAVAYRLRIRAIEQQITLEKYVLERNERKLARLTEKERKARHEAEAARREAEAARKEAEEATQAKSFFLATMSHEIRTPMNGIIGITHLLMEEDPKPGQLEYLKTLRFSAENLLVLINDILDFSKIEAGKIQFESIPFNLPEVIHAIRNTLVFKAEEKGIALQVLLDPSIPPTLMGDPVRLNQIFTNLISNALKFTSQGYVEIRAIIKKANDKAVTISFAVSDTGIGIPEDRQAEIFESFTQSHADTTRKYGGTGLGLTITKRLIELMNSRIGLKSKEGVGSEFYFDLQFEIGDGSEAQPQHSVQSLSHKETDCLKGVKLLLVDDNEVNRVVASRFLKKWGVLCDTAVDGIEAVEKAKSRQYDLILMDLQMPQMDGYQATKVIRAMEDPYFQQIPIVALTASAMLEVQEQVYGAGMNDYLTKPFNPKDLHQKVVTHMRKTPTIPVDRTEASPPSTGAMDLNWFTKTAGDDTDFAKSLINLSIEAIDEFQKQYESAIQDHDVSKLKFARHKAHAILESLELQDIQEELQRSEQLLQEVQDTTPSLSASFVHMQTMCEAVIEELKKNLDNLVVKYP